VTYAPNDTPISDAPSPGDDLGAVYNCLISNCRYRGRTPTELFESAIRQAIDEVIDGPRTGRWSVAQLEKTEKTYIGTKIEIVVRTALGLERRGPLDTWIADVPVDIKWSFKSRWQIPHEAISQICLLLGTNAKVTRFSVGLLRCELQFLNAGQNQDGKRTISLAGRKAMRWVVRNAPIQPNFIATLPDVTRTRVFSPSSGQARIRELVTLCPEQAIPRTAIETVAQQKDPMRRLRVDQARHLGGMRVLSGRYARKIVEALGHPPLGKDEFMSVRAEKFAELSAAIQSGALRSRATDP